MLPLALGTSIDASFAVNTRNNMVDGIPIDCAPIDCGSIVSKESPCLSAVLRAE